MFGGSEIMNVMLAAGAAGMAKKAGLIDSLPSLPVVGRVGAGAVFAHFWAKNGGGPFARHLSLALASVAAYQMASKGEIDGIDGEEDDATQEALGHFPTRQPYSETRQHMDYIMGDEEEGLEGYQDEMIGAPRFFPRKAAPHRPAMRPVLRLGPPPAWRQAVAPGVDVPGQVIEQLPFRADNNGVFTGGGPTAGLFYARPQRAFRGERLLVSVAKSAGATGVQVVINPGIFVGTNLVGADLGDTPIEAFAANAFGVRMMLSQATPGMEIKIPVELRGTLLVGESISIAVVVFGRSIRG